jgi:hypothetical protein
MPAKVVVRKVKGGKMFRIRSDISTQNVQVRLDGDFFLHPEESLERLEAHLRHCMRMDDEASAVDYLRDKLDEDGIRIIGADAADLVAALWEARG